jgi:hypothetical protein
MANKAYFHQNSDYNAVDLRMPQTMGFTDSGVIGPNSYGWNLTQNSITSVDIAPGHGVLTHTSGGAGKFLMRSDAITTLSGFSLPSGGTNRRWLVYAKLNDAQLAGTGTDSVEILYSDGAAGRPSPNSGATPALPTLPANCLPLWDITVIGGNTLNSSNTKFLDLRPWATGSWNQPWGPIAGNLGRSTQTVELNNAVVNQNHSVTFTAKTNRLYHVFQAGAPAPWGAGIHNGPGTLSILGTVNGTHWIETFETMTTMSSGYRWIRHDFFLRYVSDTTVTVSWWGRTSGPNLVYLATGLAGTVVYDMGPFRDSYGSAPSPEGGSIWSNS